MNLREMLEKRDLLLKEAEGILNLATKESRDLTEDEKARYDEITTKEIPGLDEDISRRERLANLQRVTIPAFIGMGDQDLRSYSVIRAINAVAAATRGEPNAWKDAQLELEASQETAKRIGKDPQGFYLPFDVMRYSPGLENRDLVVGTATAGGYFVDTDLLAASMIELLRNRMLVRQAGASVLGGLVGDVAIPKQTGGATAYWVGESGAPTESQQTLGQLALTPHTVGAFTDYSRKLLKQSSLDVEMFVRQDLAAVLALAIDYAALHGSGASNQPTGIASTSGIGSVVGGTNGLAPTWAHIVKLEEEVAVDNADVGRLAYMTNAKVRSKLKQTMRVATYGDIPIWEVAAGANPLNGYGAFVTNQVSSTLDKGTSTGVCSAIFFGNWADLIIGMWGALDILVDPYTGSTSGTTRVVALQDVDVGVRHAESFAAMLDALTT